jgi:hypothetical protein
MKKLLGFLLASVFVYSVSAAPVCAQESTASKPAKEVRWEGTVIRIDPAKSIIDVKEVTGSVEKRIHYDSATKFTSQYHGDKTINKIEASDVKEGDRVICLGTYDDKKEFQATTISKRLSHSPTK